MEGARALLARVRAQALRAQLLQVLLLLLLLQVLLLLLLLLLLLVVLEVRHSLVPLWRCPHQAAAPELCCSSHHVAAPCW